MKRLALICIFGVVASGLSGQQDPKFSQSMFMSPYFNPGAVGSSNKICLLAGFKNMWGGIPDAPTTTTFTAHMPFNLLGRSHGVGINLTNDNYSFNNDFLFSASYAYRIDLGNGKLGIGLNVGMANQSLEPTWITADIINENDIAIPSTGGSVFALDMGLGAFYNTEKMYVGVSTTHLNQATYTYPTNGEEVSLVRHYYLMAGYNIQLTNPMFEVMPNLMVQSDARLHHIYLNTNIRYNKKFWGGVSYSVGGALSFLAGIEMLNGLRIGYSYDFDLSAMMRYNTGSHEVTLRYCFDLSVDKSPSRYKSIRFL